MSCSSCHIKGNGYFHLENVRAKGQFKKRSTNGSGVKNCRFWLNEKKGLQNESVSCIKKPHTLSTGSYSQQGKMG